MKFNCKDISMDETLILPTAIKQQKSVENAAELLAEHPPIVTFFKMEGFTILKGKGAYIVLDFGKEIAGGVRILVRDVKRYAKVRISFGESLGEAVADLGYKGAQNDHSPRDFEATISLMSDLTFGQTAFRFVKIELLDDVDVLIQNVFAVSRLQHFDFEGFIETDDPLFNKVLDVCKYTMKMCFQNGVVWDGVKRDRLVWSGDLNAELLCSMYVFGATPNIKNSLDFLKYDTPPGEWVNGLATYSAWWVINLLNYCELSGDTRYLEGNRAYIETIIAQFVENIGENGFDFSKPGCKPFFDWPTDDSNDRFIGSSLIFMYMAQTALKFGFESARVILQELQHVTEETMTFKQTLAFKQLIDGKNTDKDLPALEKNGAHGFSTFMSYFILKGLALAGSQRTVELAKEYYGAMLHKGATTFWEDFDLDWAENSCGIDELPPDGQRDIHGDFGNYCYKNYRHSLCHGWSCGVYAFAIEHLLGMRAENTFKTVRFSPHLETLKYIKAAIPTPYGILNVTVDESGLQADAPPPIEIIKE
ncbi:MAG: hypothetical protein MJ132_00185 [Clostridia bacterium]|nr:hypothetical protein [Clostridia bacterium]